MQHMRAFLHSNEKEAYMKTKNFILMISLFFTLISFAPGETLSQPGGPQGQQPTLDTNGNETSGGSPLYTFENAPVPIVRIEPVTSKLPGGETHWYEVVYLPEGGINWVQAKALAEQAGGYLVTVHSDQENEFVFNLIKDKKFWFSWDASHNYVMSGPFIGAFQPEGSKEPDGGWKWVSGENWTYSNWCKDGVNEDRDPRPNNQPNDATGNQNVAAYGEVNEPVSYWGDFPHKFGTYNSLFPGKAFGFIIEYNNNP